MSAWTLIPCLVALRAEFNLLSPARDRGADGSIGDSSHTSTSDHSPDEDSLPLRPRDPDSNNEVHALDIDSTGPWPGSFDAVIRRLVARERAEYESTTMVGRLQYVIWDRRIASRSWGWAWQSYTGADPHTNHAHFSARYTAAQEVDTRPWGVYVQPPIQSPPPEDDMDLNDSLYPGATSTSWTNRFDDSAPTVRNALAFSAFYGKDAAERTEALEDEVATLKSALAELIEILAAKRP